MSLKFGLIVNPVAGIGGAVALKGSDGAAVQAEARARGGMPRAAARVQRTLATLGPHLQEVCWYTWGGAMGETSLTGAGVPAAALRVLGSAPGPTSADDTRRAARAMQAAGVDLVVFAGGDGTARDLAAVLGLDTPALGIPAGVKMHSGVFATSPERAGELLVRLIGGGLVGVVNRAVRDLDEAALRRGEISPRRLAELRVPELGGYLQHTKEGGRENESLAITEIAADVVERIEAVSPENVVLGPGGTLAEIKRSLGFAGTLLGFDVWARGTLLAKDVTGQWLLEHVQHGVLVLSFTRAQGFLIGRGNQQLGPRWLERLGRSSLWVVGTRSKLATLEGRPLLLDTDDPDLDRRWSGLIEVTAGYDDRLLYRLASHSD